MLVMVNPQAQPPQSTTLFSRRPSPYSMRLVPQSDLITMGTPVESPVASTNDGSSPSASSSTETVIGK